MLALMLFAGAIELDGETIVLFVALLVLFALLNVALCLSGGLVAWWVARRRDAFLAGTLVFSVAAGWLRVRVGLTNDASLLGGWIASAATGWAFRSARRVEGSTGEHEPAADPRSRAVLVVVLLVVAGLVSLRARKGDNRVGEDTQSMTRHVAEEIGHRMAASDAHTANDLALIAGREVPGGEVLTASGDRTEGTAEIVVRIDPYGERLPERMQCWRYRLGAHADDAVPVPVDCPDVAGVDQAPAGFDSRLGNALGAVPVDDRTHVEAVRASVAGVVDHWLAPDDDTPRLDVEIEVEQIEGGPLGVAVRIGLTDCAVARLDLAYATGAIRVWHPDPALLRSDQTGCHPTLTASGPPG